MDLVGMASKPSAAERLSADQEYAPNCLSAASGKEDVPSCQPTRKEGMSTGFWQRTLEQLVRALETTPFLFLENAQHAAWVPQVLPRRLKQTSDSHKPFSCDTNTISEPGDVDSKSRASSCFESSIQAPLESECAHKSTTDSGENTPADVARSVCRVCHCEIVASERLVLDCGCHGKGLAMMHNECAVLWFSYKETRTCEICRKPVANLPSILPPSLNPKKVATSRQPPRPPAEPRKPLRQDSLAERMLRCLVELCSPDEEQSKARRHAAASSRPSSIHAPNARSLRA